MHNVGIIWQYGEAQQPIGSSSQSLHKSVDPVEPIYPLLGRRIELMMVAAQIVLLDEPINSSRRRNDLAAIIFLGEDKIGRTRLLQFIADCFSETSEIEANAAAQEERTMASIRLINCSCHLEQRFNEFSLLRSLLRQLLCFQPNERTQYEREQYLLRLFDQTKEADVHLRANLFLLNDLLAVNFRRSPVDNDSPNVLRTYETILDDLLLHILNQLIDGST
jgi:hypothetical protein